METAREYRIAPEVLAYAEKLGIYGTTTEMRIKQMATLAEKYTHPPATHRFRQYILTIQEDTVTMLDRIE
jgi:hypothetical protein